VKESLTYVEEEPAIDHLILSGDFR